MSQDRAPRAAVLDVASILADTEITPEQRARLDVMVDSGRALMGLLNYSFDLSKIESGAMQIHSEAPDLRALAGSVKTGGGGSRAQLSPVPVSAPA